jgi:cell division protein FtsQ
MITVAKLHGLLRTRNLKVRKKSDYSKSWKSTVNSYGDIRQQHHSAWSAVIGKIRKILSFSAKTSGFVGGAEKRKRYGIKALKIVGVAVFLVLALTALRRPVLHYAATFEFFRIKDIVVSGYSLTSAEEIKNRAGIDYKTSMFSVSVKEAARYIEDHPWIQSAGVKKIWPDGIEIVIKEHRAAALLVTGIPGQEKMVYINRWGETLAPVKKGDDLDYPVITGLNGGTEEERAQALAEAISFLKLIAHNNPNLPAQSVSEIHFDRVEGLIVRLVDFPFPIYFGRGDVAKKYTQLRNVLAVLYKKRSKGVDISQVEYIRMDYLEDKVLVAQSNSG